MPRTRPVRDGWILAVLPEACRRVHVTGDTMAATLRDAGLNVIDGPLTAMGEVEAVIGDFPSAVDALRFCRAAASSSAPLVIVAVCGGRASPRERTARVWRALELATTPAGAARAFVAARRVAGVLEGAGRRVTTLPTGDRSRTHTLGSGGGARLPVGAVVSASRGEPATTVMEAALRAASAVIDASLHARGATMTDSGKLLVRAGDEHGRRFMLRLGAGSVGRLIETVASSTRLLADPAIAPAVRERVVAPIARGEVGGFHYALEAEVAGRHPRRMTAPLWEDCMEFLITLFSAGGPPMPDADGLRDTLEDDARLIGPVLDRHDRDTLQRLPRKLTERLGDLPLGWAHGDFWPDNLLVESGRLAAVIDWDDAAGRCLPLLDLLDLRGLTDPGTRRLTPGPRLEHVLRPLARAGGDERIRRYCAAIGIPADPETLEALAVAWWLQRVAHDLRDCPDKVARPRWLGENVAAPLAVLARS